MIIETSFDAKPNGSDLAIVTVVLQYDVFATVIFPANIFSGEHDGHEFYGSRASVVWKA